MTKHAFEEINQTSADFSFDKTVIDLFEVRAAEAPSKIAVIGETQTLTYGELNSRANALAHTLRKMGIGCDDIVPVCIPRALEMIIAVFGILKAGAAYLPLDYLSPPKRLLYVLDNAKVRCLLSVKQQGGVAGFIGKTLFLDDPEVFEANCTNPNKITKSRDLVYVCYTSGSTGQPKGVLIEHHSLVNRLEWMQRQFPINTTDCLFQKTPLSFDVSVWEIFWWAIVGASVVLLPPKKEHDVKTMVRLIIQHGITVVHFVPSVFRLFLNYLSYQREQGPLFTLKWVFSSGEKLSVQLVDEFYHQPGMRKAFLVNLYGPTEATVDVSYFICDPLVSYKEIPIGRPIQNTRLYVLTDGDKLAEIDQPGELVIAGVGLARGYLNEPLLTQQKFIHLPEVPEKRVYKTGDIAKLSANGEFIYLGRLDDQVKVRGLRIELGEIECHLNLHTAVKASAVIVTHTEMGDAILTAFIMAKDGHSTQPSSLAAYLQTHIPPYMVPQRYICLKEFPLTGSGKVDRKELSTLASQGP